MHELCCNIKLKSRTLNKSCILFYLTNNFEALLEWMNEWMKEWTRCICFAKVFPRILKLFKKWELKELLEFWYDTDHFGHLARIWTHQLLMVRWTQSPHTTGTNEQPTQWSYPVVDISACNPPTRQPVHMYTTQWSCQAYFTITIDKRPTIFKNHFFGQAHAKGDMNFV